MLVEAPADGDGWAGPDWANAGVVRLRAATSAAVRTIMIFLPEV